MIRQNVEFLIICQAHNGYVKKMMIIIISYGMISNIYRSDRVLNASETGVSINSGPSLFTKQH